MSITIVSSETALSFVLTGALVTTLLAWVDKLDNEVVREQYATGSYHGRFRVRGRFYQHFKEPYYNFCSGSRCFKTVLRPDGLHCEVEIWHPAVEQPLLLDDPIETLAEAGIGIPQLSPEILTTEFQSLTAWEHWTSSEALSGRYAYRFTSTKLGYAVEVQDLHTQTVVDVTDYMLW